MAIITLGRLMKSAGIGKITELGKVLGQQPGQTVREVIFSNGRKGTYHLIKDGDKTEQIVSDGVKRVVFSTSKGTNPTGSYFRKRDLIDLYPTHHEWKIGEYVGQSGCAKMLMAGRSTISPIDAKPKIVNGKIRNKVKNLEEIHNTTVYRSDKVFGTFFKHEDVLLSAEGKSLPIYRSPSKYSPACDAQYPKDLSKNPIFYSGTTGYMTQYTGQTPISVLNRDLGANFQSGVEPLWSKAEEVYWRLQ